MRNHLPVPEVDVNTYRLEVEVEGTDKYLSFSLDDLKKLPKTTIVATLMCAGNRRSDMNKVPNKIFLLVSKTCFLYFRLNL